MCVVNNMPTMFCHLFLFPQYYEMSYGLNIEMHKQVRKTLFIMIFTLSDCFCHTWNLWQYAQLFDYKVNQQKAIFVLLAGVQGSFTGPNCWLRNYQEQPCKKSFRNVYTGVVVLTCDAVANLFNFFFQFFPFFSYSSLPLSFSLVYWK